MELIYKLPPYHKFFLPLFIYFSNALVPKSLSLLPRCRRRLFYLSTRLWSNIPTLVDILEKRFQGAWLLSLHASSCSGLRFLALSQGLHIPAAFFTNLRVSANLEAPNVILRRPAA